MGISGTEVARDSADIIILDDNFSSIVKAVQWGRCVYDNIRKFLMFQLCVSTVALFIVFVGAVSSFGTPLTGIQLLWVNLIMNSLAALALGTELPTPDLLRRKPHRLESNIITPLMWRNIGGMAGYTTLVLLISVYALDYKTERHLIYRNVTSGQHAHSEKEPTPTVHYTIVFNVFIWIQIFNLFNARKVNTDINVFDGIFRNKFFPIIWVCIAIVQILVMNIPRVDFAFGLTRLSWDHWLWCIGLGLVAIPLGKI